MSAVRAAERERRERELDKGDWPFGTFEPAVPKGLAAQRGRTTPSRRAVARGETASGRAAAELPTLAEFAFIPK